jgi:hypothetical protein
LEEIVTELEDAVELDDADEPEDVIVIELEDAVELDDADELEDVIEL